MERTYTFVLDKKIVLNSNKRMHHMAHAVAARSLREYAYSVYTEENGGEPYSEPLFHLFGIEVLVFPPTKRRLDPTNLQPTVKPLIDAGSKSDRPGEKSCGLWEDDDWKHLNYVTFKYGGLSGVKDTYKIVFRVKEL